MTDIFEIQTAFEGTTPLSSAEGGKPNGKAPRRKARAKKAAAPIAEPPHQPRSEGRPPGAKAKSTRHLATAHLATRSSVGTQTNGTGKLLLSVVGLDEAETTFVASMLAALENHPKKSRAKIVGALGRIFA